MSESLNRVSFYNASKMSVSFVADLWDSEYARTESIQIKLFWACLTMKFIKNIFFRWSYNFFDFSDTEVLDTILTDNKSDIKIVILRDVDLIIKSLILMCLKSHFQEFQSWKYKTDFKMLSFDELFSQMMREDEIQWYHKDKNMLYDKKNLNVNSISDEKKFNKNDNEKLKLH